MTDAQALIRVAVVGNPNTGKTSLLNTLLGLHLHVGNWPGKTVERRSGTLHHQGRRLEITDLPGIYSVDSYSDEELITRDYLGTGPEVVVQLVDVNALERNLLLSFQLLALHPRLVLAFNFNAEARRRGARIDAARVAETLGLPVVEIEAHSGTNKERLLDAVVRAAEAPPTAAAPVRELADAAGELHHQRALAFLRRAILPHYRAPGGRGLQARLDGLVLNRWLALPLMFLLMAALFQCTFVLAQPLVDLLSALFQWLGELSQGLPLPSAASAFLRDGVINGLGTVVSFTPLIFILFLLIAALEGSGLLVRMVVAVDRIFALFGLSGRSFVPMVLGFGCNVPAIMAARIIRNRRERLIAVLINPFISCSARLPVYLLLTAVFFPRWGGLVVGGLYAGGVMTALAAALVLTRLLPDRGGGSLIMELPPYRLPRLFNMFTAAWQQTVQFLRKAGGFIFGMIVLIWLLANLPPGAAGGSVDTAAGRIGGLLTPLLAPLGFGHWSFAVALLFGVAGKEVIIGALGTLNGAGGAALEASLAGMMTPAGALAFMVFVLLYSPCLGSMAVMRRETGSWGLTALQAGTSLAAAWLAAFAVYRAAGWVL